MVSIHVLSLVISPVISPVSARSVRLGNEPANQGGMVVVGKEDSTMIRIISYFFPSCYSTHAASQPTIGSSRLLHIRPLLALQKRDAGDWRVISGHLPLRV
ncbi:hypothetical protein BX600DRAFT_475071 [Xylariales sp. PMI_506]|nr:hypothetical protein BX600DRAFT_475071 [Xylariales sp. PMI_506]